MTETSTAVPFKITHRWSDRVVYQAIKATTAADALLEAVAAKADLCDAYLANVQMPYGANLVGARLDGANLDGARLVGANLVGARLDGANLDGANLVGANLVGANLGGGFIAASSDIAYVGPVGSGRRTVYAFRAKAGKRTVIVYRCGCFIGTESDYLHRIVIRYGKGGDFGDHEHARRWLAECKAALTACKAIAKTWPKMAKAVAK